MGTALRVGDLMLHNPSGQWGMIISDKSQILVMFSKLYKHLEEINESLKTGMVHSEDAKELAAEISVQLELINESLLSQTRALSQQQPSYNEITVAKREKASFLQLINFFM